tara:strand:- start:6798 stop:8096 length:1299 start_codon:yes stop_codon:yes gene_type:complete
VTIKLDSSFTDYDKMMKRFKFKKFNNIGKEEIAAVNKVVRSGVLSKYLGERKKDFLGGKFVNIFEKRWSDYFKVKYSAAVNSWSSGLVCCVGAVDIEPGDEIILPSITMTACAAAILTWNAIPVFADVDPRTYSISIKSIKKNLSKKTKAIMAVDIFGLSCDIENILRIAKKYNLKVITDSAQAVGSRYKKRFTGTLAHVGGFSLNYHKHIHTGEGGICVTNDKAIYEKIIHIRNHGEAVTRSEDINKLINNIGFNFRLGEIESAIGIQQLKKLKKIISNIQKKAKFLDKRLNKLKGISIPFIPKNQTHSYYVYPINIQDRLLKIYSRKKIVNELITRGVPVRVGCANLHLQKIFQKKIAYGKRGFPWKGLNNVKSKVSYSKGICPIAEKLNEKTLMMILMTEYDFSNQDLNNICNSFEKVWNKLDINNKLA